MAKIPVKLQRFVDASEVELLDLGPDANRPVVPIEIEELTYVQGPRIFHWLIGQCNGKMEAEVRAQVSHSTMSRWVNSKPGRVFGQRHDARSCRPITSIWFGYPSPFPGFDRIVEEIHGEEQSFLRVCVQRYGLKRSLQWMRGQRGFGLEMLDVDHDKVVAASSKVGIPAATRRRWQSGVSYPKQWRALDLLCSHVLGLSWLETILRVRPLTLPRRVSKEALLCLIEDSWEQRS